MDAQDHFEIHNLYAAYCHRMDSGDFDGWARLFTPDGLWERVEADGTVAFSVEGHAAIAEFAREDFAARGSGMARHWMGNIMLEGEPPRVLGRTYGFLIQSIDGDITWMAHGNFTDDLVKLPEGWRIKSLKLTRLRVDTVTG